MSERIFVSCVVQLSPLELTSMILELQLTECWLSAEAWKQVLSPKTKARFKKDRAEEHSETQKYKQHSILIKNVLFLIKICNCVPDVSSFNHVRLCLEHMNSHAHTLTHSHWILHVYDILWLFRKAKWDKVFNPAAAWQNIHPGLSVRTHCHRLTTCTTSDAFCFTD